MNRRPLYCFFLLLIAGTSYSQIQINGTLIEPLSGGNLAGAKVSSEIDETTTDDSGHFSLLHPSSGTLLLQFEFHGELFQFSTDEPLTASINLGRIGFEPESLFETDVELPSITLENSEDQSDINFSGLLQSGDDLFGRLTDYSFSPARFRRRGLEAEYSEGYLNHVPVNDLESGGIYFSQWGGLNDVMKVDDEVIGAEVGEWGFGGMGSTFNTDLRSFSQRKQFRLSYAVTNRNYRNRITGTWSTGMLPSGWAFSFSGTRRWSKEGYIPGTFYDGYSYYLSAGKKLSHKHSLNLALLASPFQRGGNSLAIQEMYDLADDHYYNAYWGYQQGEKRSSRIYSGHQPFTILRHDWTFNEKLNITTAIGYQFGNSSLETLDWLYANDPRPDYYRRLPSYAPDSALADQIRDLLSQNEALRQVQWDKLYEVNLNSMFTVDDVDGIEGNQVTGRLSRYVMEERRSDIDKKSGNIVLQWFPGTRSQVLLGLNMVIQDTRNYKVLADLLGGEFYLDWDKFAEQDFPGDGDILQNDLRRPNRIVREGDQFGYDYFSKVRQQTAWLAYNINLPKFEISLAGAAKHNVYWRTGNTINGKFPDNSYGDSEKNDFILPSAKASIRFKADGRNYVTVLGMISEAAPTFRNVYVSPRTRHSTVAGIEKEQIRSGEIRYDLRSPYLKLALSGYYIQTLNGIESTSFYHDDQRTFINLSLTGIDKEFTGIEAAIDYTLIPGLSVNGAASVGQYTHTSRPTASITQDNLGEVLQQNITIYAKNLYVSGTPQSAYTAGITYRSKQFWTVYANVNHYAEQWINFNPIRRTVQAVEQVEEGSPQWIDILQQEKSDPGWTLDVSFYKSWLVNWPKDRTLFGLNIGISNLLNNTDYINGGFEQYRFDFATADPARFPTKYSYMQGLNYFIQFSMRL